ncbi:MaoC domain protein dehydratase [Moritella viscosa]|uniref:MaoC family dehydratase n=1 Tax=Moritella viscosa TaxID=80854 RepID=UPI0009236EEF|nr:MaoC family dehydratase [Moritella viscosa]SGZ09383.1 MaoC domain protein dehydratase [Moritella viscosa]
MKDKILSRLIKKDGNRYIESHGIYYDDFEVGDIYEHQPGRTVTEVDNIWQSLINMNTHPLHIDSSYAAKTEFKKPLVSSLVTFSIVGGLSLTGTSIRAIANLGWKNIDLHAPVFVGDTLYAESKILNKRTSASRAGQGIVTVETTGKNQCGDICLVFERSFLVHLESTQNYNK